MSSFDKQGILDRLLQLDDDLLSLYPDKGPFDLVVLGGSAIVLRDLAPGKTHTIDIDALQTSAELDRLLARYDINTHADTFRFQFPSGFEERLVEVSLPTTILRVFTLSNEDLVITKLLAWRAQDEADVIDMLESRNVDVMKLHQIVDDITELRANLDDAEWSAFAEHLAFLESRAER